MFFSPNAKRYWIHCFQYLYIWFASSTISWITTKDFVRANRYKKMGYFQSFDGNFRKELLKITTGGFIIALVLPLVMVPLPAWIIIWPFVHAF
jgi:linoleoyl-CoA desaturase